MNDTRTQSITNSTITGSTLNLGEISGQVQNAVNQLPAAKQSLKDLLSQVQSLLESSELSAEAKAEGLAKLKELAEAAQKPKEERKSLLATALGWFSGISAMLKAGKALKDLLEKVQQEMDGA